MTMRLSVVISGLLCLGFSPLDAQTESAGVSVADVREKLTRLQSRATETRISLEVRDSTRLWLIKTIAQRSGLKPIFNGGAAQLNTRIPIKIVNLPALDAVLEVLKGSNLIAKVASDGSTLLVRSDSSKSTQKGGTVTGVVVDSATSKPVAGTAVSIAGTKIGALTNEAGLFVLTNVPSGERIVTVKNLGYRSRTQSVLVEEGGNVAVRFVFAPTTTILSGIVTTATGVQERRQLGNDITTLNVDSIQQTAPITSVTDLLETRVPGLQVLRTSGQPGAPSRIRLRGTSSLNGNNDPIIIVDGIRVFSAKSDTLFGSRSLAQNEVNRGQGQSGQGTALPVGTPSPLDQLDPNSIERIDVFKGPSATSMYGSDAANGVIVITTKRGRSGDTRWSVSTNHTRAFMPGSYPDVLYVFGHGVGGGVFACNNASLDVECVRDSVARFQALNAPDLTVLGRGHRTEGSLGVSGGVAALTYNLTGSAARYIGLTKLPNIEVERWRTFMNAEVPGWMRRPENYTTWGGTGSMTAQPASSTTVTVTTSLLHSAAQSSSLSEAIGQLASMYVDTTQLDASPLIKRFYERNTSARLTSNTALNVGSSAIAWLPLSATLGLSTITNTDKAMTPRGTRAADKGWSEVFPDTSGHFSIGRGTSMTHTLNIGATRVPLSRFVFASAGVNLMSQSVATLQNSIDFIPSGASEPTTFGCPGVRTDADALICGTGNQRTLEQTTYGWYAEPQFNMRSRFFLVPGFRFDGGSASGSRAGLTGFPKLNLSWIAVDPEVNTPFLGIVSLLRPRLAFGIAGVQPGPTDKLRILRDTTRVGYGGGLGTGVSVVSLGNTQLRPERSQEAEGGFDAELWGNRLSLQVTQYRKMTHDALVNVDIAQSVYGSIGTMRTNIGLIRNTGTEVSANVQVIQRRALTWIVATNFSKNSNKVIRLAPGQILSTPTLVAGRGMFTRIVPGYPLFGRWARPILGFTDRNNDGRLKLSEILLGDSLVYVGQQQPKYQLSMNTNVTAGRFSAYATVSYEHGLSQINASGQGTSDGFMNPDAPLGAQAASVAYYSDETAYGLVQTVNTLRFQTLSINYAVPTALARKIQARSMDVALQGGNLGLRTNYRGKDPNVNAFVTGNDVADTGQLPQPRTWTLRLSLRY